MPVVHMRGINTRAELLVLSCEDTPTRNTYKRLAIASFEFPEMNPGAGCAGISIHASPYSSQVPQPSLEVPFYADYRSRLLVFFLIAADPSLAPQSYYVFVPSVVIEGRYDEFKSGKTTVTWEEWAQEIRLVEKSMMRGVGEADVRHTRCLIAEPALDGSDDEQEVVKIYDFPISSLCRAAAHGTIESLLERKPPNCTFVAATVDHMERPDIWAEPVITGLPYRKVTTDLEFDEDTSDFKLAEDGIVMRNLTE